MFSSVFLSQTKNTPKFMRAIESFLDFSSSYYPKNYVSIFVPREIAVWVKNTNKLDSCTIRVSQYMKDRDFPYQLHLLYLSGCFIWKTKGFSYIINETFKGRFANMRSLRDMNRVVTFIFCFFFTAKGLMLADSWSLKSIIMLVFLDQDSR